MLKNNPLLDDIAKMAGGAAGSLLELRKEVEVVAQAKVDQLVSKMQLVTREEFEVVQDVALKARAENEELREKIAQLEKMIAK